MEARRYRIGDELETIHAASFGWALTCCGFDRQEAQDVLQASYLKAIEGRARFNGHSSTRTWFFSVVRLTALERRRQTAVRNLAMGRWRMKKRQPVPVLTPELLTAASEQQERLRTCLGLLSRRQRDVLHLVFYQDLTIEESANVLGVSVGSARTHYERGKARLRKLLSEETER